MFLLSTTPLIIGDTLETYFSSSSLDVNSYPLEDDEELLD